MSVIAATVEDRETAARMAEEVGVTFLIAYGVTEESVAPLAPWWTQDDRHGRYLQPMEFLIREGSIIGSIYASGPIGRMEATNVASYIGYWER